MQQQQMQAQQQPPQGGGDQIPPGQPGSQQALGPASPMAQAPFDNTQGLGMAGNFGGSSPVNAAPGMDGMNLAMVEGRDNRGLRMPPEGRPAVQ